MENFFDLKEIFDKIQNNNMPLKLPYNDRTLSTLNQMRLQMTYNFSPVDSDELRMRHLRVDNIEHNIENGDRELYQDESFSSNYRIPEEEKKMSFDSLKTVSRNTSDIIDYDS
jgi:hypothetical protein